jgi:pimeloyl-ACP methyl ester carboxylesterase
MIDRGRGSPIVLVPGIQGRWEWMTPTVRALSAQHRVLSFSLDDVDGSPAPAPAQTFDQWVGEIDRQLDRAGESQATIAGVSFGGLIAVCYAARRPERTRAVVLISTPAPRWRWDHPSAGSVRHPRLAFPVFFVRAAGRLLPEVRAFDKDWGMRARFLTEHISNVVRFPASPTRMAARVHAWDTMDIAALCARVTAPTLVITGEAGLDRVVPVDASLEYVSLIRGARHVTLDHTGHLGVISRPRKIADIVSGFVAEQDGAPRAAASSINKAG